MTRGKTCRPPPSTHIHTQMDTHSSETGWRGILANGMWTDRVWARGGQWPNSGEKSTEGEREGEEGAEVRSSGLLVL